MSATWPSIGEVFWLKTAEGGWRETAIVQKSFVREVSKVRVGDDCVPCWLGTRNRVTWDFEWKPRVLPAGTAP